MMRAAALLAAALWLAASPAWAAGTPAGTAIVNRAEVDAVIAGSPVHVVSLDDAVVVQEIVDVDVTLQSAGNVYVAAGGIDAVLTFRVTNLGNGIDTLSLVGASAGIAGDDFDPTFKKLVLDDGDGLYEPGIDPDYVPGTNDPILDANDPANDSIVVFVLNDIPGAALDGQLGRSELRADSSPGPAAPGTTIAGAGDGGVDAVIGLSGGSDTELGTYEVSTLAVAISKSSTVLDSLGGDRPEPGATITYELVVTSSGGSTASGLVVTDPMPANTSYVPGSISLNGVTQTDADDPSTDGSNFSVTNANAVTVTLGDLPGGSPAQTITFQVTID